MSASSTETRRRAIDAATTEARRRGIERREARVRILEAGFQSFAEALADWLRQHASEDGRVPPEQATAFDLFLDALLLRLSEQTAQAVGEGIAEAASLGRNWLRRGTAQAAAEYFADFVGADGLQLSDRLWRVNQATRQTVAQAVRNAILRGATAWQQAQELIAAGRAVPPELSLQIRGARDAVLADKVGHDLLRGENNPLRNALRVLRTEINRAFTESFVLGAFEHPEVAAVKFNLSPLHPRPDVCDYHASVNLHGLGAGVYPQGKHPYPAHPETLSFLTVVFVDEITDADRAGKETPFDWLRRRSHDMQDAVLGKHKAGAFRAGELKDNEFSTPWRQVRARLEGNP